MEIILEIRSKVQNLKLKEKTPKPRGKDEVKRGVKSHYLCSLAGEVVSVNVSKVKGVKKRPVARLYLEEETGVVGDAHAEGGRRQVSLLAIESIEKMRKLGLKVKPGDFAENITTRGINLLNLPLGTRLRIGAEALVEVSQIGKVCHNRCAIYYKAGDCIMPKEGIFARVIKGGEVKVGDKIEVLEDEGEEYTGSHPCYK